MGSIHLVGAIGINLSWDLPKKGIHRGVGHTVGGCELAGKLEGGGTAATAMPLEGVAPSAPSAPPPLDDTPSTLDETPSPANWDLAAVGGGAAARPAAAAASAGSAPPFPRFSDGASATDPRAERGSGG